MAAKRSKNSGGRVTPKGGDTSSAARPSTRSRGVNWVAIALIVLILAGLVAGAIGTAVMGGPQPATTTLPGVVTG
jgi:hypothetical protein